MTVSAEVEGRVGWITLDRPPENRLDAGELEELDVAVGRVAEAEVAVAVIRSASDKFFSAGADVKAFLERSADDNMVMCRRAHRVAVWPTSSTRVPSQSRASSSRKPAS